MKSLLELMYYGHDYRSGAGYGLAQDKYHKPRKAADSYPYFDEDPYGDLEDDEELHPSAARKIPLDGNAGPQSTKPVDRFYYVAGNTKLSDCFFRTDAVLSEVESLANSMSSVSRSSGARIGRGAATYLTPGNYRRTGTVRGFASAPPPIAIEDEEVEDIFYNLEDLSLELDA